MRLSRQKYSTEGRSVLGGNEVSSLIVMGLIFIASLAWIFLAEIATLVKIVFVFLFFLLGYCYQAFNQKDKAYSQLKEELKNSRRRTILLTEKISQLGKVESKKSRHADISKILKDFLEMLVEVDKFILFVKSDKKYQAVAQHNISKSAINRLSFKGTDKLLLNLKSTPVSGEIVDLEKMDIPSELKALAKKENLNLFVPIAEEDELQGFILGFTPKKELNEWEKGLLSFISQQLTLSFKTKRLKEEILSQQKKMETYLSLEEWKEENLNSEVKKRIFDFYALFQETETLYGILDEERLFFTLTSIMEKHLESTQVLIMLPDSSSGNLLAKCSKGLELSQFPNSVIPKESPFFLWIKSKDDPFTLKSVSPSAKEDHIYAFLLDKKFETASRFSLPDGNFGAIFLGRKTNESPYDSKDLTEFSVLVNMAGLALKNIEQYKTMEALSYTDSMTGLYNYRYFYKRLNEEVFRAERFGRKIALVIFDIDEFKVYNDTFGHQSGDWVLKQLGEHLLQVVRSIDVVSRYGGDEFCVIMPETDEKECARFMERLLKSIETHLFKDEFLEHEHHITVSLGGGVYPKDAKNVDRLIYCSDMALLKAKSLGKNKSILYSEEEKVLKTISPKVAV